MKLTGAAGTRIGESECILPTERSRGRDIMYILIVAPRLTMCGVAQITVENTFG